MAQLQDYAAWIVANKDKKGTPEFEQVAQAYQLAKSQMQTSATAGPAMPANPTATTAPTAPAGRSLGPMNPVAQAAMAAGLSGGGSAVGQAMGAMGGPLDPITIPAGGAIGGMVGDAIAQKVAMSSGAQPNFQYGRMLASGLAGAIPGGPLAKAAPATLAKEAVKYGAGNIAATALQTGLDEKRLPTAGEVAASGAAGMLAPVLGRSLDKGVEAAAITTKEIQNSVRDATLAAARKAGYVISPSAVNPSAVNTLLESVAGKAATVQEAAVRNQEITNALAKKAIGLPVEAPITESALRNVRESAAAPYREIESMAQVAKKNLETLNKSKFTIADPHELAVFTADPTRVKEEASLAIKAGADVKALSKARFDANQNYRFYSRSGDPKALEAAKKAEGLADDLEEKISSAAKELGRSDLADELARNRVKIAKAYEIEKALNLGDSNISAPILGQSLDKGKKLTGELKTIAKFQQAFPSVTREGATVPPPGVNKLKFLSAAALGAGGYGAMGARGAALAAVPFMEGPARSIALSKPYQKFMANPSYGTKQADFLARFGRNTTAAAGRNPFLDYLAEVYPAEAK